MANKKVKIELTAVNKTKAAFGAVTGSLKSVGSAAASATKGVAAVGIAATAAAVWILANRPRAKKSRQWKK